VSHQSPVVSTNGGGQTVLCPGIEISAWRAHIVLLGSTGPVDRTQYRGLEGLLTLLATSDSAYRALSLASLPEYRRNHWSRWARWFRARECVSQSERAHAARGQACHRRRAHA
jgi:hypothetical protein